MPSKPVLAAVVAAVVLAAGGLTWYLGRSAPEEASIANAVAAVEGEPQADAAAESTEAPLTDVSGSWVVTTDIGEFDFADATSTFAGFRVAEELANVGQAEAVGRTPAVSGELLLDGLTLQAATVVADFTQLVSDIPRRDNAMMRALNVEAHPTATFTLTEPVDVSGIPAPGEVVTASATGVLEVNGMPNPVTVDLEASVADGNLLVVGRLPVAFADYGVTAPTAGPVVTIAQEGTVEVQLWFARADA